MPESDADENGWIMFDADKTQKFISEVRSKDFPALFDCSHYELFKKPLSFYDGYSLYALSNQIMYPFYEMYYLSNGENHQYLDGTIFPFQALLNLDAIALHEDNVEEYLAFYFSNVFDPERKINYITDPRDTPYSGARAMGHHFQSITHHNQRSVYYDQNDGAYHVQAPLLYNGETVKGDIAVSKSGVIEVRAPVKVSLLDNSVDDAVPSYIHPHEKQVLEENMDILRQSETGRDLLASLGKYNIKPRVVAGIPHCGFALAANQVFIVVPAYQTSGNGYQAIDLATAIREAEHILMQETRPDPDGDVAQYHQQNYEANLDVALVLCKIAEECEKNGYSEFLERFRKKGFGKIYNGYQNNIGFEALYELYLDLAYKNVEEH